MKSAKHRSNDQTNDYNTQRSVIIESRSRVGSQRGTRVSRSHFAYFDPKEIFRNRINRWIFRFGDVSGKGKEGGRCLPARFEHRSHHESPCNDINQGIRVILIKNRARPANDHETNLINFSPVGAAARFPASTTIPATRYLSRPKGATA